MLNRSTLRFVHLVRYIFGILGSSVWVSSIHLTRTFIGSIWRPLFHRGRYTSLTKTGGRYVGRLGFCVWVAIVGFWLKHLKGILLTHPPFSITYTVWTLNSLETRVLETNNIQSFIYHLQDLFSSNSETITSKLTENLEEMFLSFALKLAYINIDIELIAKCERTLR